jgi:hypothetical protein
MQQFARMMYAPKEVAKIAEERVGSPRAYAMIRMYGDSQYVALRDRTDEFKAALRGLVDDLKAPVYHFDYTGRELHDLGAEWVVGAGFSQTFRVMFV